MWVKVVMFVEAKNKNIMEKLIRDGKVAVLVSNGFGAGWSTWNDDESLLFSPKVVEMVLDGNQKLITKEWCNANLGIDNVYCGGAEDLEVVWIRKGDSFRIDEYDGSETLIYSDEYKTA